METKVALKDCKRDPQIKFIKLVERLVRAPNLECQIVKNIVHSQNHKIIAVSIIIHKCCSLGG